MSVGYPGYRVMIDGSELGRPQAVQRYESEVLACLNQLLGTQTGTLLLRHIGATGFHLLIKPYTTLSRQTIKEQGRCNAFASEYDMHGAAEAGTLLYSGGKPMYDADLGGYLQGNGHGSSAEVRFSPRVFERGGACQALQAFVPGAPGSRPAEVLFHEMVHAYRMLAGKSRNDPTFGHMKNYDGREEFVAILLSNIYARDPGNRSQPRFLRADHHGFRPLEPPFDTSEGFLKQTNHQTYIEDFCSRHCRLAGELARVPATFNPVRAFLSTGGEVCR